jgi:23S rRNA G2445 N2-methylase RlmL
MTSPRLVRLFATVAKGFEYVAREEIEEWLAQDGVCDVVDFQAMGVVSFAVPMDTAVLGRALELRSIDDLFATLTAQKGVPQGRETGLKGLDFAADAGQSCEIEPALTVWHDLRRPRGDCDRAAIVFRATGERDGIHGFRSPELAGDFASGVLVQRPDWKVDLKAWVLELFVKVADDMLWAGIPLSRTTAKENLYKRNRFALCPTTLKASIAYCMLRLARTSVADIVLDPMTGSGTLVVECAQAWGRYCIGGDIDDGAVAAAAINCARAPTALGSPSPAVVCWSATRLPLRSACVDLVATDMPYGHRCGSRCQNRRSYASIIAEIARVLRPGGRAILLTFEHALVLDSLARLEKNDAAQGRPPSLHLEGFHRAENSGYLVTVFVLTRSRS